MWSKTETSKDMEREKKRNDKSRMIVQSACPTTTSVCLICVCVAVAVVVWW